jgi:hypothetical protein
MQAPVDQKINQPWNLSGIVPTGRVKSHDKIRTPFLYDFTESTEESGARASRRPLDDPDPPGQLNVDSLHSCRSGRSVTIEQKNVKRHAPHAQGVGGHRQITDYRPDRVGHAVGRQHHRDHLRALHIVTYSLSR